MQHFRQVASGINVAPAVAQIDARPELWNENAERKTASGSPHAEMVDIWVRYRARHKLTEPRKFIEPHEPVFYPAWTVLTELHPIVFGLMNVVRATCLGGILITKMPSGTRIAPHDDRGSWHAEHFTEKVWIGLRANELCVNHCRDESITIRPGEAWHFDNLTTHGVENNGDTDRVTLIVCMRTT